MITVTDLRGTDVADADLPRASVDLDSVVDRVKPILEAVHEGGAEAVLDLSERFDGVRPASLRVPEAELDTALASLDTDVRAALEESIRRSRLVHRDQRRVDTVTTVAEGATVTERWVPVDRAGLYVPGGKAVLPSSVVMNVVPAQEAGVPSLAIASPPQAEFGGLPHPTILAAAALLGVREVYAAGGAQAIAMFAYGAKDAAGATVCAPVDLVTGPGNVWVAAAKRLLKGRIGTDSDAGPTEIAVLADDTADPRWVAADLISQAEHDVLAAAVLVTPSRALADAVLEELERQVPRATHAERITESLGAVQSRIVLVDDLDAGLVVVNAYAAEHLEIHAENAREMAKRVRSAGAIFLGGYSPVSLGDYCAGSNHVLPTSGTARHSGGLSVQSFLRGIHVIDYDEPALAAVARHVVNLSRAENLPAHGEAVIARFPEGTFD
jgi:histidinol dehydrogenase